MFVHIIQMGIGTPMLHGSFWGSYRDVFHAYAIVL